MIYCSDLHTRCFRFLSLMCEHHPFHPLFSTLILFSSYTELTFTSCISPTIFKHSSYIGGFALYNWLVIGFLTSCQQNLWYISVSSEHYVFCHITKAQLFRDECFVPICCCLMLQLLYFGW